MLKFAVVPVLCVLLLWAWQFFNWVWWKPRKIERLLKKQGLKGNPYKTLVGDSKETSLMYEKAYSKPIGLDDDIVPRVMPNILHTIQKYGIPFFSIFHVLFSLGVLIKIRFNFSLSKNEHLLSLWSLENVMRRKC